MGQKQQLKPEDTLGSVCWLEIFVPVPQECWWKVVSDGLKSNLRPQIITTQLAFGRTGVRQWKQSMTTHMHTVSERKKKLERKRNGKKKGEKQRRSKYTENLIRMQCLIQTAKHLAYRGICKHMSDTPEARNRKTEEEREREMWCERKHRWTQGPLMGWNINKQWSSLWGKASGTFIYEHVSVWGQCLVPPHRHRHKG